MARRMIQKKKEVLGNPEERRAFRKAQQIKTKAPEEFTREPKSRRGIEIMKFLTQRAPAQERKRQGLFGKKGARDMKTKDRRHCWKK